jgi:hypothetical protein
VKPRSWRFEVKVPLPGQRDLKKALRIYVAGRNRAWTVDEKRAAAGTEVLFAAPDADPAGTEDRETQIGVAVPETLQFHRGPGTWRGEIPGGRRTRTRRDDG